MESLCSSKDLDVLVKTKEFRLISSPLFRHVIGDASLEIGPKFLWTVIWELCALEPEMTRPLSLSYLAKRVGKSEDTIRRWVNSLRSASYLELTYRHAKDGSQLPSLFRIAAPAGVVRELLRKVPNRKLADVHDISRARNPKNIARCFDEEVHPQARQNIEADFEENTREETGECAEESACVSPVGFPYETCASVSDVRDQSAHVEHSVTSASDSARERTRANTHARTHEHTRNASDTNAHAPAHTRGESSRNEGSIGVSGLIGRLNALRNGPKIAQEKRTGDFRADVPGQDPRVLEALAELGLNRPKTCQGEGGKSAETPACKSATQERTNNQEKNNYNSSLTRADVAALIAQRVSHERYLEEIYVSLIAGSLRKHGLVKGVNIACRLIREGRWQTPRYVRSQVA